MAICDKISTAGSNLQSKLNARGVTCTYGKNSDGKQTINDMANLITASNLKGSADSIIHISASRPYLLEDETTDLIVTLHNGVGTPLANKSITISDGTSLYNGITDIKGHFILYNIEVDHDTTFTANYDELYTTCRVVGGCTTVDMGVKSNYNDIYDLVNFSLNRNDSYSVLVETSTSAGASTTNSSNKIGPAQCVEFDVLVADGGNTAGFIYIRNNDNSASLGYLMRSDLNMGTNEWAHVKLQFNDSASVTVTCDKLSEHTTLTLSSTSENYRVRLNGSSGITTIHFKNLIIY